LARAPDERVNKAFELYKSGMKLVEIASQLNLPPGTVRRWKSTYKWDGERSDKKSERSDKNKQNNKIETKPIDDGTKETMMNENLTHEQRLFCIYYSKSFNATQSYLKAYGCSYETANVEGSRHLVNPSIREEINRLKEIKRQQIVVGEEDMAEYHMRIAFADIGDYLTFGREEVPVMSAFGPVKDDDGNELTKEINTVKLKESNEVDTQLIQEVKQGKDGVSIKLADKQKSLEWLDKYFIMNPFDKHRINYDIKKQQQDTERSKAQINLIKAQTDKITGNNLEIEDLSEVDGDIYVDN